MAVNFDVNPEELKNSANYVSGLADNWAREVNSIYAAVGELRVSFQGQTSDQFNERLNGYLNDFQAAYDTLKRYCDFINNYAIKVNDVEDTLKQQASQLNVGK